jgi:hypothetical protein
MTLPVFILRRHPKFPPLPPAQPLAHYMGRGSGHLPQPYLPHKSMESDQDSHNLSEKASLVPLCILNFRSIDSSSTPSFTYRPAFGPPTPATTAAKSPCPLSVESQSDGHASTTELHTTTTRLARSSSLSRSRSRRNLSRKPSTAISNRTVSTHMRSMNTIRGAPHCSHNNIDIVIPAPLAPQL